MIPEREPREALYKHLRDDPNVAAVVGQRIHMARVSQAAPPAMRQKPLVVIYPPISRTRVRDLAGVAFWEQRLQITAMGSTQLEAEAAARAVMNAIDDFRGVMAGAIHVIDAQVDSDNQIDQEDVDEIHHHVDVLVRYKEVGQDG